jgi:hemoglobin
MDTKTDIQTEGDIKVMVHSFYDKVRADNILSPVFNKAIPGDWEPHLQTMCEFWNTMILYTREYLKDPISKHVAFSLEPKQFERWLLLFEDTVNQLFEGPNANAAKSRAQNIARIMQAVLVKV